MIQSILVNFDIHHHYVGAQLDLELTSPYEVRRESQRSIVNQWYLDWSVRPALPDDLSGIQFMLVDAAIKDPFPMPEMGGLSFIKLPDTAPLTIPVKPLR
jgi:hypothetical protein